MSSPILQTLILWDQVKSDVNYFINQISLKFKTSQVELTLLLPQAWMDVLIQIDQTILVFISSYKECTNHLLCYAIIILFTDFWSVYKTVLVLVKCDKIDFMLFFTGQRCDRSNHDTNNSVHYLIISIN